MVDLLLSSYWDAERSQIATGILVFSYADKILIAMSTGELRAMVIVFLSSACRSQPLETNSE
jgi:hypothetical protein